MTVAALYVTENTVYRTIPDVDVWPESRDATTYPGPHPIVAHPPCGSWGRVVHWYLRADDHDLAPLAVEQLARWGGVLEHPRDSGLWRHMRLPDPGGLPRMVCGALMTAIRVDQCDWGHPARKPTWLLLCGVEPPGPRPARREPTHVITGTKAWRRKRGLPVASARMRISTPPAFAAWLVALARSVA